MPTSASAQSEAGPAPTKLVPLRIEGARDESPVGAATLSSSTMNALRSSSSDTARLLEGMPGVSTYGAGGISSLPSIRGLADERLKITVDGMDLMSACPNHMNPALSLIDPGKVEAVTVFAGITPVSEGGDSIGGAIQIKSARPKFAASDAGVLTEAKVGTFFRSNGNARGHSVDLSIASTQLSVRYSESGSESDNYRAAGDFKRDGFWKQLGQRPVAERQVASSGYRGSKNREIGLALAWSSNSVLHLTFSEQKLDYQGFPNQRMDMIFSRPDPANPGSYAIAENTPSNVNRTLNLRYLGQHDWGELEARLFRQTVAHHMDLNQDRFIGMFMPMKSDASTLGGLLKASIPLTPDHLLRVGTDFQQYRLDDWWPPIGLAPGSMCCDDFQNIRNGKRDRIGVFSELESSWNAAWLTLFGIRGGLVHADADPVQGYSALYAADAARFNQRDRSRNDTHLDLTALVRYTPDARQRYEAGIARKTRSPSLYERYPWSTFPMAALMNNFVGDGNAYLGNPDLKPEVAYTASATAHWHDEGRERWDLKLSGHVTYVDDYIDARRCPRALSAQCNALNSSADDRYVILQYVNQRAMLQGIDVSGSTLIAQHADIGRFYLNGMASYVDGRNLSSDDDLYHIMPLNAKIALEHRSQQWTNTVEVHAVSAKKEVSRVRNEVQTPGYTLLNLRSSFTWKNARLDLALENALNKFYLLPLGGAYLGQGNSMTTGGIPWGMSVPGRARSLNIALNLSFQ
ncbi:MAG: TonB-dependent receptor [Methyloversatilis sp.]|nr:TonB-dependent receptor [Methyloversatilis sp.]